MRASPRAQFRAAPYPSSPLLPRRARAAKQAKGESSQPRKSASPRNAVVAAAVVVTPPVVPQPAAPKAWAEAAQPLYLFLLNKWYFDELYDAVFVKPAQAIGRFLWKKGDEATIDGGINGLAMGIIPFITRLAGRAQSGYLFHYAFAMVIGIVVLVTYMTIAGGAK